MRLPDEDGAKLDPKAPLRLVSRGDQASGRKSAKLPRREQTLEYWSTLKSYLDTFNSVLEKLKVDLQCLFFFYDHVWVALHCFQC